MNLVVERSERLVLQNWKRNGASFVLVRLKCEAIILAAEQVEVDVIARVVDRSVVTVKGWFQDWRKARLASVVTGHAGNQNAAKLTAVQKGMVAEALSKPPSESGVPAKFWDVPALKNLISMRFDVEYESESSLQLLMHFAGMSFKYPDAFDRRRDEAAIAARMAELRQQVVDLLGQGYEVFCADEVRVEHEAEIRRMWLPVGQRTKLQVDRERAAQSYFGALNLRSGVVDLERFDGQQNAEGVIGVLARFQRRHPAAKIAIVWDNAPWHKAKELTKLFRDGEIFSGIVRLQLPPYAPDHNPIEHVWGHAKGAIANFQRDTPELTFSAFENYVRGRTFEYDFEGLPIG